MSDQPMDDDLTDSKTSQVAYHGEALVQEIEALIEDPNRRIIPMTRVALEEIKNTLHSLSGCVTILEKELNKFITVMLNETKTKED